MTRLPVLAALLFLSAGSVSAVESLQLDANENLFYVLAALNAAGFDEGIKLPDNSPLRLQLREYLAKQDIPVMAELKRFYQSNTRRKSALQDLSQYISFALSVNGPPDFEWRTRDVEVPPDAKALEGLRPLLITFYRQANLEALWKAARPAYEKELDRYHAPVLAMTSKVDGYLRVSAGGYLGRRFLIYIDLLAPPQQVQTRNYGDDAFVVATPAAELRMYDLRHAYLHFELDPIMIKYGIELKQKSSLLDMVQLAPLEESYKNDFVLLADESLIKAVECRIDRRTGPEQACTAQAMKQGYVLTQYFSEQLPAFEQQQQGMRYYAEEMVKAIDLKREVARISSIHFDAGQLQRKAREVSVAGPELSPSGKTLEQAEDLYTKKSLDAARALFQKALEERGSAEEHAQSWYGLARIATLQNQPDAAVKLFEKTVGASPDAFTKAWSYVYLARLSKAANDLPRARQFYKDALEVPGASERALEAARKESQNISQNQEIPK